MLVRLLLVIYVLLAIPTSTFAYSYGDPNKEEIAEAYKEIAAKLEKKPEDWDGAYQAFSSKKKEIALEFGDKVAQTLADNFSKKQKELVLHNYKAVLVLNVNRRLDNVEQQFEDYAKAKLLLAKGRGTFNVLSPYIKGDASQNVYKAFDQTLNALGNPGLFGVGTVPANKSEFLTQAGVIRDTLQPLYQIKVAQEKPAAASTTQALPTKPVTKPAPTAQPIPEVKQTPDQTKPPAPLQSAQPSGQQSPIAPTSASPTSAGTDSAAVAEQAPPNPEPTSALISPTTQIAATQETPVQSKVNPVVTINVIAGLVLVIGSVLWLGKRKGII